MVWGADGITVCEMYWSTEEKRRRTAGWRTADRRSDNSHIANAALIVEAVNAYDRLRAIEAAARRYQSAEWAHRLNEDEPRMTPEHNARVEEWRAADRELRSLLMTSEVPSDAR